MPVQKMFLLYKKVFDRNHSLPAFPAATKLKDFYEGVQ